MLSNGLKTSKIFKSGNCERRFSASPTSKVNEVYKGGGGGNIKARAAASQPPPPWAVGPPQGSPILAEGGGGSPTRFAKRFMWDPKRVRSQCRHRGGSRALGWLWSSTEGLISK
ncbi:hypothetical protein Sjap_020849 [Stephania japonica]|uniref:Uncharacterized protein n=1 Tax=Stephania japonica TaxID=461633 RepID=A0AAP0F459_9MAGN